MVMKLKEGCLVELNGIKVVKAIYTLAETHKVEISYFDEKKNPKEYIDCESEDECNVLVDKLLLEIQNSKRLKFY